MNLSYQYPFVYFPYFGIKLSLISLGLLIIILLIYYFEVKKKIKHIIDLILPDKLLGRINQLVLGVKKKIKHIIDLILPHKLPGKINRLVLGIIFYLLLFLVYFFQELSGGKNSVLVDISQNYLKYEFSISIILILALLFGLFIKENKDRYLNVIIKISAVVLYLSVFSTLITKQINIFESGNLFCYLVLGLIFICFISIEIKFPQKKSEPHNSAFLYNFHPSEKYEDLFPVRKKQAIEIMNRIEDPSEKSFSICISGQWGTGKTSLLNGILDELEKKGKREYKIIRINALEIDTLQSLFTYFFSQIKQYLKDKGAYTGILSEYESFVAASVGIITNDTFGNIVSKHLFKRNDDYRFKKEELETLISEIMGEDRIIVVLDDIERCNQKKVKEFIFFIKEIATMGNCISIFITDYKQVVDKKINELNEEDYVFFEKFFNYRFNLETVSYKDSMKYFEKKQYVSNKILDFKLTTPIGVVENIEKTIAQKREDLNSKLKNSQEKKEEKEKLDSEIKELDSLHNKFIQVIQQPRKLVNFYNMYIKYCKIIENMYSYQSQEKKDQEIKAYFNKINLSEILFLLAYIESCAPIQFDKIQLLGIGVFIGQIKEIDDTEMDKVNKQLVKFLFDILINEIIIESKLGNSNEDYIKNQKTKFIEVVFNNAEMANLVNSFTSEEEEWFNAIEAGRIEKYSDSWIDLEIAVLRMFASSEDKWQQGEDYLKKLLDFTYKKVENKEWSDDDLFKIFNTANMNEYWLSQNICIMKYFYNLFFSEDRTLYILKETKDQITFFSLQFIIHRVDKIIAVLSYWCDDDEAEKVIKSAKDNNLTTYRNGVVKRLDNFINDISAIKDLHGDNVFSKLHNLAEETEKMLKDYDCYNFDDVKNSLQMMKKSIEDIEYFDLIIKEVEKNFENNPRFDYKEINLGNITPQIEYFKKQFFNMKGIEFNNWHEVSQEFVDFFNYIWTNKEKVEVTAKHISELDSLVTDYYQKNYSKPMFYRKVVLDLKKLLRQKEKNIQSDHKKSE